MLGVFSLFPLDDYTISYVHKFGIETIRAEAQRIATFPVSEQECFALSDKVKERLITNAKHHGHSLKLDSMGVIALHHLVCHALAQEINTQYEERWQKEQPTEYDFANVRFQYDKSTGRWSMWACDCDDFIQESLVFKIELTPQQWEIIRRAIKEQELDND